MSAAIESQIVEGLAATFGDDVEVVEVQVVRGTIRLFIDAPGRPGGVDLGLCEQVARALTDLTEEYALEVSSPGVERPLRRPDHYRRFVGERVAVRLFAPLDDVTNRRSYRGTLTDADEAAIELTDIEDLPGALTIPYDRIAKANLVFDWNSPTKETTR